MACSNIKVLIRREQGAAMVFVAIVIVGIFAMVGLAIDSMTILSVYRNSQFSSNMVTLAALEAYYKSDSDDIPTRINEAETRARELLSETKGFNQDAANLNDPNFPNGLKLEAGQWVQPRTNGVPTGDPYFSPYSNGTTEAVNAFRLSGSMTENARIFFLDKILGNVGSLAIPAEAIATVAPRRAVFLIDLSSTVVTETYKDREPADQLATPENGRGAAYGFILYQDNLGLINTNFHDGNGANTNPADPGFSNTRWGAIQVSPTRSAAPVAHQSNPLIHFKDDYKLTALFNDTDYSRNAGYSATIQKLHPNPALDSRFSVGNARVFARVDGYRQGASLGPQPLGNLILGIRTIIEEFKERKVYGDKVSLIFFDEGTDWRRSILPTDDFDYLLKFLSIGTDGDADPYAPGFQPDVLSGDDNVAAVNASGLDPSAYVGQQLAARMAIFPQPAANTNLILPLTYAQEFLSTDSQQNSGMSTTDFVVVASDGLANCKPNNPGYSCSDTYTYYRDAMTVLKGSVTSAYVSASTPIHFLMTGAMSGPHTLDMPRGNGDSTCMSDSEARSKGLNFVAAVDPKITAPGWYYDFLKPARYDSKSADKPFYDVNVDWYDIVKQTRGLWIPIRTKGMPAGVSCVAQGTERTCAAGISRLDYDPYCTGSLVSGSVNRTTREQTLGAAEKILGQNPYIIVRTRSDSVSD